MQYCSYYIILAASCGRFSSFPPVFRRQEQVRFKKTSTWANAAVTKDKSLCTVLSMKPSLQLMGRFFKSARRYSSASPACSLATLTDAARSPVSSVIDKFCGMLNDEAHADWAALVSGRGWSPELYRMAPMPMLLEIGSL
eukprot:8925902-Pyramimonas_sp.AAC.1